MFSSQSLAGGRDRGHGMLTGGPVESSLDYYVGQDRSEADAFGGEETSREGEEMFHS